MTTFSQSNACTHRDTLTAMLAARSVHLSTTGLTIGLPSQVQLTEQFLTSQAAGHCCVTMLPHLLRCSAARAMRVMTNPTTHVSCARLRHLLHCASERILCKPSRKNSRWMLRAGSFGICEGCCKQLLCLPLVPAPCSAGHMLCTGASTFAYLQYCTAQVVWL